MERDAYLHQHFVLRRRRRREREREIQRNQNHSYACFLSLAHYVLIGRSSLNVNVCVYPYFLLSSHVPYSKLYVFVLHLLDIESDRGHSGEHFTNVQLVQNGRFPCCVEAQHDHLERRTHTHTCIVRCTCVVLVSVSLFVLFLSQSAPVFSHSFSDCVCPERFFFLSLSLSCDCSYCFLKDMFRSSFFLKHFPVPLVSCRYRCIFFHYISCFVSFRFSFWLMCSCASSCPYSHFFISEHSVHEFPQCRPHLCRHLT